MSEREVTDNLSPQGNVAVLPTTSPGVAPTAQAPGGDTFHPLEPEMSPSQRDTLSYFFDAHDEVRHKLLPSGVIHLETVDYDDGGQTIRVHTIGKDGIPF